MITDIVLFKNKQVRRQIHKNEWWFSVVDIVEAATGNKRPRKYWNDLKKKLTQEGYREVSENIGQLKMQASDGKEYLTDCVTTEAAFRIVQSIPSPRVEPLKRWLARVGYERVQEIEDPELGTRRTRMLYKLKGYSEGWIEKRMRGIDIREELTDEWQKRGAEHKRDYEILTAEISKAAFGVTPSEYRKHKGLTRQNLRDHMDDLELIFTMLGERSTTEIHRTEDSKGMPKLKSDSVRGGRIAGNARKHLEKELGHSVVSKHNYLRQPENKKLIA